MSSSTCVCVAMRVATIGLPGGEVRVDLEGRVLALDARRGEHVGERQEERQLGGRALAGEDAARRRGRRPGPSRAAPSISCGSPPISSSCASGTCAIASSSSGTPWYGSKLPE